MRFDVLPIRGRPPPAARSRGFLVSDNWDDYTFKTMYHLVLVDSAGERHAIGNVKIGKFGTAERSRVEVPDRLDVLDEEYFSLGQDDSYYERLQDRAAKCATRSSLPCGTSRPTWISLTALSARR